MREKFLDDFDGLCAPAEKLPLPRPIRKARVQLEKCLKELRESGCSALGPALCLWIKLACRVPQSRVVLISTGHRNVGLGCAESFPKAGLGGVALYTHLADIARASGVVVNVLSFVGTSVKILSSIAYNFT